MPGGIFVKYSLLLLTLVPINHTNMQCTLKTESISVSSKGSNS